MSQLDSEDDKLVTLARAAATRIAATSGAAVRDDDGRTYAAAEVNLPSLRLSALQLAVAQAAAAGAETLEAAAIVAEATNDPGIEAVRDLAPAAPVFLVTPTGVSRVEG